MLITVAICTWNRAELLERTLERMIDLQIPPDVKWELLVVDNNCTDRTDQVLDRYLDRLPLRKLFESKQGLSFARNCASVEARGDLLIWTDDDVLVEPDWLVEYVKATREWPEAGGFGGAVDPWLEMEPPKWFSSNWAVIKGLFVVREYYENKLPIPDGISPVGANMAVRMSIAKKHPFNEKLGRVGRTLSGGEDCEWIERLQKAGISFAWVGSARVKHFIPKERLSEDFLRMWYEGAGKTSVRMNGLKPTAMLFGVPRWMWKPLVASGIAMSVFRLFRGRIWLANFRKFHMMRGMIQEIRSSKPGVTG